MNKKKIWIILSLIVIAIAIPVTIFLFKKGAEIRTGASVDSADLFFVPDTTTLPPSQNVKVMINSDDVPVGFVNIDIDFDKTKVKVDGELTVTSTLKNVIKKSSNAEMNSSGKISIALGLSPDDTDNAPVGLVEIASFVISNINSQTSPSTLDFSNYQIVNSLNPVELSVAPRSLILDINPAASSSPTAEPTAVPTTGSSRYKFGDINEDGVVNILDYSILFDNFGKQLAAGHQFKKADINDDGAINILDYSVLFDNFGKQIE